MSHQILEKRHRSQIFEKILKEDREGTASRPRPRPVVGGSRPATPAVPTPAPAQVVVGPDEDLSSVRERGDRAVAHGDFQTAVEEYGRAVALAEAGPVDPVALVQMNLSLGAALQRSGDFDAARDCYARAQTVADGVPPGSMNPQQVEIFAHQGSLAVATGDIATGETQFINAVNLYEQSCEVDPMRLSQLYLELGNVYTESRHFENAMEIVLEGLTFLEDCKAPVAEEKMAMFKHLATIAYRKGEPEAAVNHLLEAYRFAQEIDGQEEMITLEVTLATAYSQYGEFEAATEWYQTAIRRQESMNPGANWALGLLYANLGQVQARMGAPEAAESFSRSLDLQLSHLSVNPEPC